MIGWREEEGEEGEADVEVFEGVGGDEDGMSGTREEARWR